MTDFTTFNFIHRPTTTAGFLSDRLLNPHYGFFPAKLQKK